MIARVALAVPHSLPFDYCVPEPLHPFLQPGCRVLVPFGYRVMTGVVIELAEDSEFEQLKDILQQVDSTPLFTPFFLSFTKWISKYYLCSWGEVLDAALPTGLKPKYKKVFQICEKMSGEWDMETDDENWIRALNGQIEKEINPRRFSRSQKKKISDWQKNGWVRWDYQIQNARQVGDLVEVVLLTDENTNYIPRKESKAECIIEMLKQEGSTELSEIKSQVKNATSVIRQLIDKKVIIKKSVKRDEISRKPKKIEHGCFITLNSEQSVATTAISGSIDSGEFKTFLLQGVTGSGKTEVFLHAVRDVLNKGKAALVLLPEISLTPQAVFRFKERFGENIAVLHSGMAEGERCKEWWKIKNKECSIVIGARSAIFAPLENIGLIVVDEEHDSSFKQQESPYYNARDAAVFLGKKSGAVVILGSATPAVESMYNAEQKKYEKLVLTQRANQKPMPEAEIISLKDEQRQKGVFYLSRYLVTQLKANYEKGQQALIFLNRRGYAAFLTCTSCGLSYLCENCSIAMTWHKNTRQLTCHHCGYTHPYPTVCPGCKGNKFKYEGIGTQRVERDLKILFPQARFLRMDRDTVSRRGTLEANIALINQKEVDFIIGTQLISKGHDFKHIGIVCIVMADMSLNIPDFRSSERSFQLISQVSGRAGRGESGEGRALIQSYNPGHYAIQSANKHCYESFYAKEIDVRRLLENPPFKRLILVKISDENQKNATLTASEMVAEMQARSKGMGLMVLGPVEAPIQRVNKRYYWHILLKGDDIPRFKVDLLKMLLERKGWNSKTSSRISVDVDPYYLL